MFFECYVLTGRMAGVKKLDDVLYPPISTNKTGMLKVSDLHTVYWEESGCPEGLPGIIDQSWYDVIVMRSSVKGRQMYQLFLFPVMVLHGGPGGASQEVYRQYFDPRAYRVIQIDQRGCGKSTPHAELQENNTQVASLLQLPMIFEVSLKKCSRIT